MSEGLQYGIAANYDLALQSEFIVQRRLVKIDRLNGENATQHDALNVTADLGKSTFGSHIDISWSWPVRIIDQYAEYWIYSPIIVGFGAFVNVDHLFSSGSLKAATKGLKLSLGIQNRLDSRQRLVIAGKREPAGYEGYQIDPLGRTLQISIRKRFECHWVFTQMSNAFIVLSLIVGFLVRRKRVGLGGFENR